MLNVRHLFVRATALAGVALLCSLPSMGMTAPITVHLEGTISSADFFGSAVPANVIGSAFSAIYRFDTDNAKVVVNTSNAVSEVYAATSEIGCRVLVGFSCIANDGPGSPVITSYRVSTIFGDFFGGLPLLGFNDTSGVMTNRGFPSIFPPDGNEIYTAAKSQAIYFLSADPETNSNYSEWLFQRSWNLHLQAAANGLLYRDYDDLTQTPDLSYADSNYFFFNELLNVRRDCTSLGCSAPDYGFGSFTFEGNLTSISVPEPATLLLFAIALFAFSTSRFLRSATQSIGRGRSAPASDSLWKRTP